ncbi:unnamed protein product [Linum tenue]|uniref:Beta-hydroxyacyl-ACP dehydratase n=1 Tax=Linum tenue TaxID=586396 RepID=A0AAV0MQX2_9ROSI|nr:unnamed protein product [Linum tenue]
MASINAVANSLLLPSRSSSSSSSSSPLFPNGSNALSPSKVSLSNSRSQSSTTSLRMFRKPIANSPLHAASAAADEAEPTKDETPIELKYPAYPTVMDINQIREILPHRFPFLLVDRVIEYNPGVSAVAIKNVTINDNFFPGHFPERPIMPGVLMVEVKTSPFSIVTRSSKKLAWPIKL